MRNLSNIQGTNSTFLIKIFEAEHENSKSKSENSKTKSDQVKCEFSEVQRERSNVVLVNYFKSDFGNH